MSTFPSESLSIGSAAPAAVSAIPQPVKPPRVAKPADKKGWWWGTGRRKTAVARVRLRPAKGEGKVLIVRADKKELPVEKYFAEERDRRDAVAPLTLTKTEGKFDIFVRLHGGGYMGQSRAAMLAIARALRDYDPTLDAPLRDEGMLTRDSRAVERKKYGQSGARRRFQFSKR